MMLAHCDKGPDDCFGCKCLYWRTGGGLSVSYAGGQDSFHNAQGTLADRERQAVADARRGGYEPERYTPSQSHDHARTPTR